MKEKTSAPAAATTTAPHFKRCCWVEKRGVQAVSACGTLLDQSDGFWEDLILFFVGHVLAKHITMLIFMPFFC